MSAAVSGTVVDGAPRRRGQALKLRILGAARTTFLGEGFDASMDTVAASAGTTKATVYKHFGNKETLFVAVVTHELDRALEPPARLSRLTARAVDPSARRAIRN